MSATSRQPRVFISRTTAGLAVLAERVAEVLRQRGIEPIIQIGSYPSTHDVKGMLAGPQNLMGRKERKNSKREGTGCSVFCFFRFFRPTRIAQILKFEITLVAGKGTNLPYTSLGTLFKNRDEFLAELRQHLTAEGPVVIKGKRTIHGMGGVGKTRAAIEYAWKHADDYRTLLFISADPPETLYRNLAALCGPLVLNLPEQNEKEQARLANRCANFGFILYQPSDRRIRIAIMSVRCGVGSDHRTGVRISPGVAGLLFATRLFKLER